MKNIITTTRLIIMFSVTAFVLATTSCKKENSASSNAATTTDLQASIAEAQAIAVGVDGISANGANDSIYIINACGSHQKRDSISFSSLPASVSTYLSSNYTGYTAQKAFTIKDTTGNIQGYIVILQFNGNPVGLKFDASGNFISVLEQRQGRDLNGRGWHEGGRFEHRNGMQKDTVALSALPASIKSYFATSYATDTLLAAFKNRDSLYIVISKNNGMYATVFNAAGAFISRTQLPSHNGKAVSITQAALPASVQSYLTTTYPNYVFSKAFSIGGTTVQGYVVIIEANSTRYAVLFDAAGSFAKAKPIR